MSGRKCHIPGKFFNVLPAAARPTGVRPDQRIGRKGADGGEVFALPQTGGDRDRRGCACAPCGRSSRRSSGPERACPPPAGVQGKWRRALPPAWDRPDGGRCAGRARWQRSQPQRLLPVKAMLPQAWAGRSSPPARADSGRYRRNPRRPAPPRGRRAGRGRSLCSLVQRRFLRPRAGRGLFPTPRRLDGKAGAHALDGDEAVAAAPAEAVTGEDGLERQAEGRAGAVAFTCS